MKTWKNPSTFCHSNMVQTSSNSGAPRSQFRFQVFFGERSDCKILAWGALHGLWAVGGQSRTSSWKIFVCVGIVFRCSCLSVESSISKLYWFENICIFFWWCSALRVSFSDFNFLKVLISQSFHFRFQILWNFPCLRVGISISQVAFLKVFISESCFFFHFWGGHSQSYHFWEFPLQILHFLTETFHFWRFTFLRVPFQISSFQQVSIIESQSFHFRFLKDFPFLRVSIFEVAFLRVDHFISNFQLSRTACLRVGISIFLRESTCSCLSGMVCAEI